MKLYETVEGLHMTQQNGVTPIYILSGFLGSGKTTLLQKMISFLQEQHVKPAVIMNEIGEVNLDGMLVDAKVPMTEMLGGCICCTVRGDLSTELSQLIENEHPDVIIIEATGVANPIDILDAVTELSLFMKLDIKPLITVVDTAFLNELYEAQSGKTYSLMMDQIRAATLLIMNKIDRIDDVKQAEMKQFLNRINPHAHVIEAIKCDVDLTALVEGSYFTNNGLATSRVEQSNCACHNHCDHDHDHDHDHASHTHVTVYTHYFQKPVDSNEFEQFIKQLPREIYRAKGVLSFTDTSKRFLFQYAYRESDFMAITPQGEVADVAVFIGEHFDQQWIRHELRKLEGLL